MRSKIPIEELLRWRVAKAETDAPPAPRAARLLEMARPWWEIWPERFQSFVERLGGIQVAYGHAMAEPGQSRSEEHTSELQSPCNLVCRLLLEKKKKNSTQAEQN